MRLRAMRTRGICRRMQTNLLWICVLGFMPTVPGLSLAADSPTWVITGRVIDEQARPVEGATVACCGWGPSGQTSFVRTGPDGRFKGDLDPKNYFGDVFVAKREGLALGWAIASEPGGATLVLTRPSPLSGMVVDQTGTPIPDATVRVGLYHRGFARWRGDYSDPVDGRILILQRPEDWLKVKTDAAGRFTFDSMPSEACADFQVAAEGWARLCTYRQDLRKVCQFAAGRKDIRLVLSPEAVIAGQVVAEDTGLAIPGVPISAIPKGYHRECCRQGPVTSDEKGRFRFKGLAAGTYTLQPDYVRAAMPDWVAQNVEVSLGAGQSPEDVKIRVGRGSILEVFIRDEESEAAVCGAKVQSEQKSQVDGPSQMWTGTTDSNGLALFRLPSGESTIQAYKDKLGGVLFNDQVITADSGKTRRCTVDLPHNADVAEGRVLDPEGRPVQGAYVWSGMMRALSGRDGRFELSGLFSNGRGGLLMRARHESLNLAAEIVLRDRDSNGHIHGDVALRPAGTLIGRVMDPSGKAISAASVLLLSRFNDRRIAEVATDARGSFQIRAVPAVMSKGNSLSLAVRAQGYGTREVKCPEFEEANHIVQVESIVVEPATESVAGVVVDGNDHPAPEAVLTVLGAEGIEDVSQPFHRVLADGNGRFRIEGVCKGPVRLEVAGGYLDALGGTQDLKVVLGRQLVYSEQRSLAGKPLPELTQVGVSPGVAAAKDEAVLVCFIDVGQRPSRNMIQQISKRASGLADKGIVVFLVQAERTDPNALEEQIKASGISVPVCTIPGDAEQVRRTWNVQSLPWLILTDREHVVRAEGLSLEDLERWLQAAGNPGPQ